MKALTNIIIIKITQNKALVLTKWYQPDSIADSPVKSVHPVTHIYIYVHVCMCAVLNDGQSTG